MNATPQSTVLIFRLGSIGDTVVALPCFRAVARHFAGNRRVLLTNAATSARASSVESVLQGSGLIHETLYYPVGDFSLRQVLALAGDIRRLSPKALVYMADRPTAAPVMRDVAFFKAAGVPSLIGVPWTRDQRNCLADPLTGELEFEAARMARVLGRALPVGLTASDRELGLTRDEVSRAKTLLDGVPAGPPPIAMAPGAKIPDKDWGRDRWEALTRLIADGFADSTLVLVGAPDERPLCSDLGRLWKGPVLNLAGSLSPRESAAVLGLCGIMVCHDSGPMHLAASQNTCCVALFGNYNRPRRWYPFGSGHRVIHEPRGIRHITVERVAQEIRAELIVPERPTAARSGTFP